MTGARWARHGTLALVILCFSIVQTVSAAPVELPSVVEAGLKAYKAEGAQAAIKEWAKGSPFENNPQALSNANVLKQIEDLYGSYLGFEPVQVHDVSPGTQIVYFVMNYAKGPLFARFVLFRTGSQSVVVSFKFHTDVEQVFPLGLLYH